MRITTGQIAEVCRKRYAPVTRDMINYDVRTGLLPCYPQFGERGWNYALPDELPGYFQRKQIPPDISRVMLEDLGLNVRQRKFF